ncbi:MAG: hypothetical protein ACPGU6_05010, partial [Tenacibaculum sp.]
NFIELINNKNIAYKQYKEVSKKYKFTSNYYFNIINHLDKNLNEVFKVDVATTFPKGHLEFSTDLEYTINSDQLIDKKGNIKEYPLGKKSYSKFDKNSGINPSFRFFNDYAWTTIGPKSGRANIKKQYSDDDIFIFNLRNEDLKGETYVLKSPQIVTNREESIPWQMLSQNFKNSFFLASKDKLTKKNNQQVYHIVENTYKGEIASYSKLTVKLDEGKYFLPSHSIGPVDYAYSAYGGAFGYGTVHVDNNKETILVYGYYSNKKGKQHRVGKADGIYAYQFKKGGEILWKSYFPFKDTVNGYLIKRQIEYTQSGNFGVIHCYLDNINGFFKIDTETGKFRTNSSSLTDFFSNKKILKNSHFLKLGMMRGMDFYNVFRDKKTNRNQMNYDVLSAMILNPQIKDFLLERAIKKKSASYLARFSKDNIYIIEVIKAGRGVKERTLSIFKF